MLLCGISIPRLPFGMMCMCVCGSFCMNIDEIKAKKFFFLSKLQRRLMKFNSGFAIFQRNVSIASRHRG